MTEARGLDRCFATKAWADIAEHTDLSTHRDRVRAEITFAIDEHRELLDRLK